MGKGERGREKINKKGEERRGRRNEKRAHNQAEGQMNNQASNQKKNQSLIQKIRQWFSGQEKSQDPRISRERMEYCREALGRMLTYQGFWAVGQFGEPVLACLDPDREDDLDERWIIRHLPRKPVEEFVVLEGEPQEDRAAWLFSWELLERYPGELAAGCCWVANDQAIFQIGSGRNSTYIKVIAPPRPVPKDGSFAPFLVKEEAAS
jgi:hypothetical protein